MTPSEPVIISTRLGLTAASVAITGRLDRAAIARLHSELITCRDTGAVELCVDLSGLVAGTQNLLEPNLLGMLARTLAGTRSLLRELGGDLIITGAERRLLTEIRTALARINADSGRRSPPPTSLPYRPETADQP
jgi:hypothetical protein